MQRIFHPPRFAPAISTLVMFFGAGESGYSQAARQSTFTSPVAIAAQTKRDNLIAQAQAQLVTTLKAVLSDVMQSGQLDEANRINKIIASSGVDVDVPLVSLRGKAAVTNYRAALQRVANDYEAALKVALTQSMKAGQLEESNRITAELKGTAASKHPPAGIPVDAAFFNGKWYRVYGEKISWQAAKTRCEGLGGRLGMVPDKATQDFVLKLSNGEELWLGATDEKVEGTWRWEDGTKVTFAIWAKDEPNNWDGAEPYLLWRKHGWYDVAASYSANAFLCEWKHK